MAKRRLFQWDDVGFDWFDEDSQLRDEGPRPSTGGLRTQGRGEEHGIRDRA